MSDKARLARDYAARNQPRSHRLV